MNGRVISLEEAERSRPAARLEAGMEGRTASDARAAVIFTPTPVKFRDPATIPRRQFIYGRHYIRAFLSATVAPGGVGKSSLALVEAVAMAAGRSLHGIVPPKATKVWYVNLEDPREEIERRIAAICLHFGIEASEIQGRLFFDGREIEIILASQARSGAIIAAPVKDALAAALTEGKFDVFVLDPFVSVHRVAENDNGAIDAVAKTLGRIAGAANCAIECVHHTRKNNGAEITAEDGRGASALVAAARSVRVLNRMSEAEAAKAGVAAEERRSYFRSEIDKANLAPAAKATWYRMASVPLGNGSGGGVDDQDYITVATPWAWPDVFEGVSTADLRAVQAAISAGRWRENSQATDWAGKAVAQVLNLDPTNTAHKAKINALLKTWIVSGALVVVEGRDARHEVRSFIEVGTAADD
jgi:hypothetical protein